MILGTHMTIAKGFAHAAKISNEIGANTFQFFSRNPRGSTVKEFDFDDIEKFEKIRKENNFGPILAHAPYTLNLASSKDEVREFSRMVLKEDIKRMDKINIEYFNFHPGSHIGAGSEYGINQIIEGLNESIVGNENIIVLLETMSGKGSEIGYCFEDIKNIIEGVKYKNKIGVCMDLCHVFSAGYDIKNNLDNVLDEFNSVIGLDKLMAIHLNDSMTPFNSRKDRHEVIGKGSIGLESILNVMKNKHIKNLPFYLETPLDDEGHKKEIRMIKNMIEK